MKAWKQGRMGGESEGESETAEFEALQTDAFKAIFLKPARAF